MTGLAYLPLLLAGLLGTILLLGERARERSPEAELRGLVREHDIAGLMASLRDEPAFVRSSRSSPLRNRMVFDLGDVDLDVRCYTMPRGRIEQITAVYYQSSVGWVVETFGRGRRARFYGWLLDVRSHTGPR